VSGVTTTNSTQFSVNFGNMISKSTRRTEAAVIISASRRTDIPGCYPEWLMNRLRAGWCEAVNPVNRSIVTRVSLAPRDVEAIVFWSKNPRPLLPHLDEVERLGLRYFFLLTLNRYPRQIEPAMPPVDDRVRTFRELSDRIGAERCIWRYDPILLSQRMGAPYHLNAFEQIAAPLRGHTRRVIISLVDFYRKTERRLAELERQTGERFCRPPSSSPGFEPLMRGLVEIATRNGMEIQSCAEGPELGAMGIRPGKCIDDDLIRRLFGISVTPRKDPGQRPLCRCVESRDIGAPDTCRHGCVYCYATRVLKADPAAARPHDPLAPAL
jgi:hypothetical protein